MKYRFLCAAAALSTLAACGGGGTSVGLTPVVSGTTPTPSPSTPTQTPSTVSYQTFAALTGNQNFRTACASYLLAGVPPVANPATAFGNGLALSYTAATDAYAISGDGLSLSFGPSDVDAAVLAPAKGYIKVDAGFTQRFIIGRPAPAAATLDYVRTIFLATQRGAGPTNYQCVFGVPTLTTDVPSMSSVAFTKVGLSGASSSYRLDTTTSPASLTTYSLENSTATLSVDLTTGAVRSVIHLLGTVRSAAGAGATNVELGTYTGTGTINTTTGSYSGQFTDASGNSLFAYFGGWFFGPQGREAGFAFNIVKQDANGSQTSAVGTVTAQQ